MSVSRITQLIESLYHGRKKETVNKFGFNKDVGTAAVEDIWSVGGLYPFATFATAQSLEVVSTSVEDTLTTGTGAWGLTVIGLDGDLLEKSESLDLTGTSAVALAGTWTAVNRMYINQPSGTGGVNAGVISARVSGAGAVVSEVPIELGQTNQAVYRVPTGKAFRIVKIKAYTDAAVSKIATVGLIRVGADCNTLRVLPSGPLTSTRSWERDYSLGGPVIEGGAWVAVRALSVGQNDTVVSAYFDGVLE